MLFVAIQNDGTGDDKVANYNVLVSINDLALHQGRIKGHDRTKGWKDLIKRLAKEIEES